MKLMTNFARKRIAMIDISDEKQPLKSKSRDGMIFEPVIDANNRLTVPSKLDNYQAKITGRISTIEVVFKA